MYSKKGYFITVEGIEGVGKSTAIKFLQKYLLDRHIPVQLTREPGGTLVAESIRSLLLKHGSESLTSEAELLLMFAGRAQNIAHVITPALAQGNWVISDRFTDASFAYQGGGRKIAKNYLEQLESLVQKSLVPDVTILLDAPVSVGLKRITGRGVKDRIENENKLFFERVRVAYLERAHECRDRFYVIDASKSIKEVESELALALETILVAV